MARNSGSSLAAIQQSHQGVVLLLLFLLSIDLNVVLHVCRPLGKRWVRGAFSQSKCPFMQKYRMLSSPFLPLSLHFEWHSVQITDCAFGEADAKPLNCYYCIYKSCFISSMYYSKCCLFSAAPSTLFRLVCLPFSSLLGLRLVSHRSLLSFLAYAKACCIVHHTHLGTWHTYCAVCSALLQGHFSLSRLLSARERRLRTSLEVTSQHEGSSKRVGSSKQILQFKVILAKSIYHIYSLPMFIHF